MNASSLRRVSRLPIFAKFAIPVTVLLIVCVSTAAYSGWAIMAEHESRVQDYARTFPALQAISAAASDMRAADDASHKMLLEPDPRDQEEYNSDFRKYLTAVHKDIDDWMSYTGISPADARLERINALLAEFENLVNIEFRMYQTGGSKIYPDDFKQARDDATHARPVVESLVGEIVAGEQVEWDADKVRSAERSHAKLKTLIMGSAMAGVLSVVLLALAARARLALAEGKRLHDLADAAFEGIVVSDGRIIIEANAAMAGLLGRSPAAVIGSPLAGLFAPGDPDATPERLAEAEAAPINLLLSADGGPVPVELRVRRILGHGRAVSVLAFRDLRERAAAEERIRYLAHNDALTGLSNRARMRERLEHDIALARRTGDIVALLRVDFDRFKAVNDCYGHAAGDRLLKEAARRVRSAARQTDIIARFGSDEFVVAQLGGQQPDAAVRVAERLTEAISGVFDLGNAIQATLTASIGLAFCPGDAKDVDGLLAAADVAMRRVKERGRNSYALFRPDMDAEARARRSIEQDLLLALRRDQFALAYQPQFVTRTGAAAGFEVLLRWHHPGKGAVPADLFIPVAEATGAIIPIGTWVLREACSQASTWQVPLRIAINVSAAQLQQEDFAQLVETTLAETRLVPSRLELEITETMLIRDAERTLATLHRIRHLGVQIAMDDFGTGYSSLSTLKAFPFDRLKIDQSFVRDLLTSPGAAAIVRGVLGLAKGLGLPVIAEGVETPAQLSALRGFDCAEVQGFLVGKPLPIDAYRHLTSPGSAAVVAETAAPA
jgi:diguanylate cyclase (GGDEF)-like protein/PAS domain S-box-containing protein